MRKHTNISLSEKSIEKLQSIARENYTTIAEALNVILEEIEIKKYPAMRDIITLQKVTTEKMKANKLLKKQIKGN